MKYLLLLTLFIMSCGASKEYVQNEMLRYYTSYYMINEEGWKPWASCGPDEEVTVIVKGEMGGTTPVKAKAVFQNKTHYRIVHPSLPFGKMDVIKDNLLLIY